MLKQPWGKEINRFLKAHKKEWFTLKKAFLFITIFSLGATTAYFCLQQKEILVPKEPTRDIYVEFLFEVYDKIQENYWEKMSDEQLSALFKLGSEKLTGTLQTLDSKDKDGLEKMLSAIMKNMAESQKKEFTTQLANIVLVNLKPLGRSALYTTKEEKTLKERVENRDPVTGQIEPTIFSELVEPDIFYIKITKISPQTFDEFKKAADAMEENLSSLILDLRGNVGGSLDILPYFLGPFIGKSEYAFELFHQGEYEPIKTQTGWLPSLVKYKKVVILIDGKTQSSAEVMASTLKKYNVGVLIGTPTKGWGTIEKVFPLQTQIDPQEKYSLFLVHRLTVGEEGQPIEGRGVYPLINIEDPNWENQLLAYFHYEELIRAVKEIYSTPGVQ